MFIARFLHASLLVAFLFRQCHRCSRADRSRNHHRTCDRSIGRDHHKRHRQSHPRRHQLRAAGDDLERGLLHHHATARWRLRRDRDRSEFSNDDDREYRGHGGQHGPSGRAACRRRFAGRRHRDRGVPADTNRQRKGDDGDQQQVHSGSAAGGRRAAPFAARPEPRRAGSQVRNQRRRRTRATSSSAAGRKGAGTSPSMGYRRHRARRSSSDCGPRSTLPPSKPLRSSRSTRTDSKRSSDTPAAVG